ncbi:MASE1 domain-containing protein [Massilia agilis]|uniref:histidine kinase n=1 Tax=Massilia agilis TaxID=1811226 RepID=A0ABT2DAY5_9BURK|nr:ATP-binding protein [Massilia agilis]MCS0807994.1 MASE1 domain-containing protein [Massilia agilis]
MEFSSAQPEGAIGKASLRSWTPALWSAACYWVAAQLASMLANAPVPLPHFRPGGAVLMAAMLLNPARAWFSILLAALPVSLLVQWHHGLPLALAWFSGDASVAVLGAAGALWLLRGPPRFDLLRHVLVFACWCAFAAPALAALPEAAMLSAAGTGPPSFSQAWSARMFGGAAAVLAIVPPAMGLRTGALARLLRDRPQRQFEAGLAAIAIAVLGGCAFVSKGAPGHLSALLGYAPLPLLFWVALRFGSLGAGLAMFVFAALVVASTAAGGGPFASDAMGGAPLPLTLFLDAVAVPMLLLTALTQERRGTLASLRHEQEKLGVALAAERRRAERLARERRARAEVEQCVAQRTVELRRANEVLRSEIAARRKALEAERAAASRFSNLFRLGPDAMALGASADGALVDVNDRWQQLFGYGRDEVIGRSPGQLGLYAGPDDSAKVQACFGGQGATRDLELRMRDRQGRELQVLMSGVSIGAGSECCFLAIIRDVTGQRRAEAELRRQREQLTHLSRVVVLGELSGALAHELNQPLAAILANAQAGRRFLSQPCPDMGEIHDILDDIVEEDKRAGEVIRRLRALFKKEETVKKPLAVADLVRDTLQLTHGNLVERNVAVEFAPGPPLMVRGDRIQLQQVLLNLVVNACDAMRLAPPARRRICIANALRADGQVTLTVADSGPGIAPDMIGKVFDPFFTTKAEGLGFGLSICRAIISQHGGTIEARNLAQGGCAFCISLPVYFGDNYE